MVQAATFDDINDLNKFLKKLKEEDIVKIDYKVVSEQESYSEFFMVIYRK
ncbi:MAG: sporulation protein Cse60 [Clostridia bacterium]|nr:sporulation protein Cse60 [Clostridia bacterium]